MTDAELVSQVLNGNQQACRYLVAKYRNLVNHIVRRIMIRDADAEDICQDVFLKVFSRFPGYRGDARLSTWIATIACNTAISCLKKKKTRKEIRSDPADFTALKVYSANDSANGYESEEIKKILLEMIETMPLHYRTLLTLFYLEEFSYIEIERITGMPEGTVKSYLYRARFLLKCKLEKIMKHEGTCVFAEQ
jgi:RNA polymerase sigma factor (sigma-70 family)